MELFEKIRQPEEITKGDPIQDRIAAFADLVAHVAFLASMPCPSFNTRFNVQFFKKVLMFTEPNYDDIPNKNKIAIRVLFNMLDVKSILYCWKAILFDATLVLISSNYSLQFYIAQGLLQLMFPLTFCGNYVQPGRKERVGMFQSPIPIIFACGQLAQDFDFFESQGHSLQRDNIAICDIDGSFTNNLVFPELENEKKIIRSISGIKNFRGSRFDCAFEENYANEVNEQERNFELTIRQSFFNLLDQFLRPVKDYLKNPDPGEEKVYLNTFKAEEY